MAELQQPLDPITRVRLAYRATFDAPTGQEVLDDLRRRFGDRQSYVQGDPYHTAFLEGQRSVVMFLRQMLLEPEFLEATK